MAKRPRPPLVACLRSTQAQYLEYLAERDVSPVSHVLDWLIRDRMACGDIKRMPAPRKFRGHYTLDPECFDYLNKLCGVWGLSRSDVVRRIIDDAQMKDEAA